MKQKEAQAIRRLIQEKDSAGEIGRADPKRPEPKYYRGLNNY